MLSKNVLKKNDTCNCKNKLGEYVLDVKFNGLHVNVSETEGGAQGCHKILLFKFPVI